MTTIIPISSSSRSYEVVIGEGLLSQCASLLTDHGLTPSSTVFLVTDENVQRQGYSDRVQRSFADAGFQTSLAVIPPGDGNKTLDSAVRLYDAMLEAGVRRNGIVVAVGGGMVGDLAGFVAATYQRGVKFAQVPTTLLAHDSSIGGKVGVNLPRGKNLVGAFHPPMSVIYDTSTLQSLPELEWQGGMAEVIKHGIIGNANLFDSLYNEPLVQPPNPAILEQLLLDACSVKIGIVEEDERESGKRMFLNLGHTVGHAVEQASHYALNHGYAVAIGISVEAELAVNRGWLSRADKQRIRETLSAHGLPVVPPDYDLADILDIMGLDKKHNHEGWTFALPRAIGQVEIARNVTPMEVQRAWSATLE